MTRDTALRTREARTRAAAARQGFLLQKSRRRDTRAADYGVYWLIRCDVEGSACRDTSPEHWRSHETVVGHSQFGASLDEIETALTERADELRDTLRQRYLKGVPNE